MKSVPPSIYPSRLTTTRTIATLCGLSGAVFALAVCAPAQDETEQPTQVEAAAVVEPVPVPVPPPCKCPVPKKCVATVRECADDPPGCPLVEVHDQPCDVPTGGRCEDQTAWSATACEVTHFGDILACSTAGWEKVACREVVDPSFEVVDDPCPAIVDGGPGGEACMAEGCWVRRKGSDGKPGRAFEMSCQPN